MPEEAYDADFPNLRTEGFRRTSDPDFYNCIAFAVGDSSHSFWPSRYPQFSDDSWPVGIPAQETVEAFLAFFRLHEFVPCDDGAVEPGVEKIALYALGSRPTHAARQWSDGTWRSKLGVPHEDIQHTLAGLEGPAYGKVAFFLKRAARSGGSSADAGEDE